MKNWIGLLALGGLLAAASGTARAQGYIEGADLSSNPGSPTPVSLALGTNVVSGTLTDAGMVDERDYLTFTIPAGRQLSALRVTAWSPNNIGFHAIKVGATGVVPDSMTEGMLLGGDHMTAALIGTDTLPDLAEGDTAGVGFTPPLGPGTYTYLIQQVSNTMVQDYSLEFVVTAPTPAVPTFGLGWMMVLMAALLATGASLARRRIRSV